MNSRRSFRLARQYRNKIIGIELLCRKHSCTFSTLYGKMDILNDNEDKNIKLDSFNLSALDSEVDKELSNTLINFHLLPHDISLVGGTYIGQIYIRDTVSTETVTISASVVNTLFSDHDAVKGEFYDQKFQNVILQLLFDTHKFYNF